MFGESFQTSSEVQEEGNESPNLFANFLDYSPYVQA